MDASRAGRLIAPVFLLLFLWACAGTTRVTASHSPLYRAEPHLTTITATAENAQDGIATIQINVLLGEMSTCGGYLPSLIPCRTNAILTGFTCTFANVTPATCAFPFPVEDRALVTYNVEATGGAGDKVLSRSVTYAGGASLTQAQLGSQEIDFGPVEIVSPGQTIPWEVARPIWWHTDQPGSLPSASHIDVGFFPDSDYPNYRDFTDAIDPIIRATHLNPATPFSRFYSTVHRDMFNLWAGPAGGDGEDGCVRSLSGAAATVGSALDGQAIMHSLPFRDCADIALGGLGTVEATNAGAAGLYIHESGHFLQGLGDEYCCDGGYFFLSTPGNVFPSLAACQSAADGVGLAQALCVQIGTTGQWHMDDGQPSIMAGGGVDADWRTASGRAVGNRFAACVTGNC